MTWQPEQNSLVRPRNPIAHTGSKPWDNRANCTGTFLPGTARLGNFLKRNWPDIFQVGGYSCRQNTANPNETSVHGLGRALDLSLRQNGSQANPIGNEIADWLLRHADTIGVQLIIWDRTIWNSRNPDEVRPYGGPVPHTDHLHVELNEDAAHEGTLFFVQNLDATETAASMDRGIEGTSETSDSSSFLKWLIGIGIFGLFAFGARKWWQRGGKEHVRSKIKALRSRLRR